jgi:putative endonuclease
MPADQRLTDRRARLARQGEDLACQLLCRQGLTVVARNWRHRRGEIDVVAGRPGLLVVCEVKTRRGDGYGPPAAAVTPAKQRRLRHLAAAYLAERGGPPVAVRFDVVAVTWPPGRAPLVEHVPGAF